MDNLKPVDIPPRPKLNDNDIEDAILIERQLQATTTAQRIEDARRRGGGKRVGAGV